MLSAEELAAASRDFAEMFGGPSNLVYKGKPVKAPTAADAIGAYDGKPVQREYMGAPKSFRDPQYASLAGGVENKLGLPDGLLHSIITNGERSNADQVSSAGARTVAQIIPSTRDAVLKQYGVDAYLSPENALEAAGLLLRDSLKRNGGDVERAVREYHGGTDPKNWGPVNNAYAGRVLAGMKVNTLGKLGSEFAQWMQANPATAPLNTQPATSQEAPHIAGLSAEFAQWQGQQDPVSQIPGENGQPVPQQQTAPEPGLMDKAMGLGEVALAGVTSIPQVVGAVGGFVGGLGSAILDGSFGTQDAVRAISDSTGRGAQAVGDVVTYQPRTATGQQYTQDLAEAGQNIGLPMAGLSGQLATVGQAGRLAAPAVRATAGRVAAPVRQAAQQVSEAVSQIPTKAFGDGPEANVSLSKPTPGTLASGGAAGADMASQRIATAENLGFAGDKALTKGQATRDQQQLRFEGETAKGASGAAFRERYTNQNAQLANKLEEWIDGTGSETLDGVQTGNKVVDTLTAMKAADKNKVRALYKAAEKAGEMEQPVSAQSITDFLNANKVGETTAPILKIAGQELVRLGGATVDEAGNYVPAQISLKNLDFVRKAVNKFTKTEAPDMAMASGLRQSMDTMFDSAGGKAYQEARKAFMEVRNKYETRGVVADLLANRKRMQDPKVAAENVFERVILKGSQEDVSFMAKLLRAGGEDGIQAWAEMRGATFRHLKEQALANNSTDQAGNTIFSPAKFEAAVKKLDANGRLEIVLGKKEAQGVRDLNDIAKQVLTVPPGAVNTSNTASVILAALVEAGISGSTLGMPVPIMTGLRVASMHLKDRRLQARIADALRQAQKAEQAAPAEAAPTRTPH